MRQQNSDKYYNAIEYGKQKWRNVNVSQGTNFSFYIKGRLKEKKSVEEKIKFLYSFPSLEFVPRRKHLSHSFPLIIRVIKFDRLTNSSKQEKIHITPPHSVFTIIAFTLILCVWECVCLYTYCVLYTLK